MTQSLGARATSLAASAALLGIAVFAAFSVSIQLGADPPFLSGPIVDILDPPPPEPAPLIVRNTTPPPPTETAEPQETTLPMYPVTPTEFVDFVGPVEYGPPSPAEITNPRWLRRPQSLASYYPRRAMARDISGQVLLDCLVDTNGALNCSVISETPTNWGFGQAALRIAEDHRMVPATRDGQAVQGRYRMRVPFELD
jgi:protein TonB